MNINYTIPYIKVRNIILHCHYSKANILIKFWQRTLEKIYRIFAKFSIYRIENIDDIDISLTSNLELHDIKTFNIG